MPPLLIYIHGFLSSSLSEKAEETRQFIEAQSLPVEFIAPQLSDYPMAAYQQLQQLIEQQPQSRSMGLIGSSLGGFTATALSQQYGLRAVVVNPAVKPYHLISTVLGSNTNPYTGVDFVLTEQHLDELRQLTVATLAKPENILVLLQTGDETLDYRQAVDYYHGCRQVVEAGGDHRFQNYHRHLPAVMHFLATGQWLPQPRQTRS